MDEPINVLIVEDDHVMLNYITAILSTAGYDVLCAETGKKAISMTALNNVGLILLDLGLPDIDGIKVLKSIREWSEVPVIVVSARTGELEKVEALDAGAEDYVTKPFGNNELLARIRAALRPGRKGTAGQAGGAGGFAVGDISIDYEKRSVYKLGRLIHLTPIEYRIVMLLSQNAGKVLTHDFIVRHVWGPYESDNQVLRVNMANIRRKLEENAADPRYILTEVRVGYKMVDAEGLKPVNRQAPRNA